MNLDNAFLVKVFFVVRYTLTLFTAGLNSVREKILQLFVKNVFILQSCERVS